LLKVSLSQSDSEWFFEPTRGFTIKETKINLRGDTEYFCTGTLDVVNGKRVNITHKKTNKFIKHLNWQFTDYASFILRVIGRPAIHAVITEGKEKLCAMEIRMY